MYIHISNITFYHKNLEIYKLQKEILVFSWIPEEGNDY